MSGWAPMVRRGLRINGDATVVAPSGLGEQGGAVGNAIVTEGIVGFAFNVQSNATKASQTQVRLSSLHDDDWTTSPRASCSRL